VTIVQKGKQSWNKSSFFCENKTKIRRVLKGSRRMRWVGHVSRMGEGRGVYRVLVENLRESDQLGDPGVDGRIILSWIFRKWVVGVWTGLSCFRIETGGGH
jgi:hypothetical protein